MVTFLTSVSLKGSTKAPEQLKKTSDPFFKTHFLNQQLTQGCECGALPLTVPSAGITQKWWSQLLPWGSSQPAVLEPGSPREKTGHNTTRVDKDLGEHSLLKRDCSLWGTMLFYLGVSFCCWHWWNGPLCCTQAVLGSLCLWWRSGSPWSSPLLHVLYSLKMQREIVSSVLHHCMMFCFVSCTCETLKESFCVIHTKPIGRSYQPSPQRSKHKIKP